MTNNQSRTIPTDHHKMAAFTLYHDALPANADAILIE